MTARIFLLALLALTTCGCGSPLRGEDIDSLGEEQGEKPSEFHRPGQPCVLCHSAAGGVDPILSIGGTLFFESTDGTEAKEDLFPAAGFAVVVLDSEGKEHQMQSNDCGNFYVLEKDFKPVYPLATEIRNESGAVTNKMVSRIGRSGSCGSCHLEQKSPQSPGVIRVADAKPADKPNCPIPRFLKP